MAATLAQTSKTHCKNGHEFTEANTRIDRHGWRRCLPCNREWDRIRQPRRDDRNRTEYHAVRYQERKAGTWQYRGTPKRRRRIGEEVLDLLLIDGGWWTAEGITVRLGFNVKSVGRILSRLRTKGLVRSRRVGLATGRNRIGLDSRLEWKAEPSQMMLDFG